MNFHFSLSRIYARTEKTEKCAEKERASAFTVPATARQSRNLWFNAELQSSSVGLQPYKVARSSQGNT